MKKAALILIAIAACKSGKAAQSTEADDRPAGKGSSTATPTQALSHKLSAYIECLNTFTGDVFQGRRTWLDQFPKGPNPKKANDTYYGPLALPDPKACREAVAKVKALAPKLPELEAAGDAYVAAITALQPITVDLRTHFEQGDYKDDKFAHAIEMHPKLLAAYDTFLPADTALGAEVDKLEDKLAADQLAELERTEGKRLRWHDKHTLVEAKKLVVFALGVKSPFEIKDLAALQTQVASFDGAVAEMAKYQAANKTEIDQLTSYRSLEGAAKELLKDSKAMLRRVRDKQAFSDGEKMTIGANNGEAVEGHPSRVIASYNKLIDASNWNH